MKLHVVLSDQSVRLYGDRAFFQLLMAECQRLASSGAEEYCEFQAIELNEQPVTAEKAEYRIFDAPDAMDMKTWSERDANAFDVVFMTIEDGDFNKY